MRPLKRQFADRAARGRPEIVMKAAGHWVCLGWLMSVGAGVMLLAPLAAVADEFRIDLPDLERPYLYGERSPAVPIDLGTPLLALEGIEVELAGTHIEGWWVGDMVEDFYVGPRGGWLILKMDSASLPGRGWKASYQGWATGPFIVTLPLHRAGGGSDWSFLEDGTTDLAVIHDFQVGWGGFTTDPLFDLTDVAVVINATPVRPGDVNGDGYVDGLDYVVWSNHHGQCDLPAWADGGWAVGNLNDDGCVDGLDYTVWSHNYDVGSPSIGQIPEPATLAALLAGATALLRRRAGKKRR